MVFCHLFCIFFFFFKQKTAYEMRISDWSSDVCSSDLPAIMQAIRDGAWDVYDLLAANKKTALNAININRETPLMYLAVVGETKRRSEEHTSELQSLMRISYAVFCLKKKKKETIKHKDDQ